MDSPVDGNVTARTSKTGGGERNNNAKHPWLFGTLPGQPFLRAGAFLCPVCKCKQPARGDARPGSGSGREVTVEGRERPPWLGGRRAPALISALPAALTQGEGCFEHIAHSILSGHSSREEGFVFLR